MVLRKTVRWVRDEWAIFSKGSDMGLNERVRWIRQWGPFALRTAGYSSVSVVLGPLTRGAASTWAARHWSRSAARGLRISIDASGLENLPEGGFVLACNHQSLIDILVLGAVLPGDFKWAAKRSLMNVPFLGWHLRLAGHVPVDRQKGRRAAQAVLEAFVRVLQNGQSLLIFPEGTRSADGRIKHFKDGAFRSAAIAACPVVPVALEGTHALMARDAADTGEMTATGRERLVRVRIGEPIEPRLELGEAERAADLRERTYTAIVSMHDALVALASG
jgi:1-acyl-sn-glycerol-3-phosphate acyltransferase